MAQEKMIKNQDYQDEVNARVEDREERKLSSLNLRMGMLGFESRTIPKSNMKAKEQRMPVAAGSSNVQPKVDAGVVPGSSSLAVQTAMAFSSRASRKLSLVIGNQPVEKLVVNEAAADLFIAFLQMMEIMFFNIDDVYVKDVANELKEQNLYRHEFKKLMNEMEMVSEKALRYCADADYGMLKNFCEPIFPYFLKEYEEDGCSMVSHLQMMFYSEFHKELDKIEACTRLAIGMVRKSPQNKLVAKLEGLMLLGNTWLDLEGVLTDRIRRLLPLQSVGNGVMKGYNQDLMAKSMKMLKMLKMDQLNFPDREGRSIREMANAFQQKLIDPAMLDRVQNAIKNCLQEYTEWTIAKLKMVMNENKGKLPFGYYRVLLGRLGSYDNVVFLLKAIYKLPNPSEDVETVMDFVSELPKIKKDTYLSHFRELCMEDKYLIPKGGVDIPMRMRKLRTIAERSGGVLPLDELKKMYKKLGTKKAMIQVLKRGGKALEPSLELLEQTKVAVLRAA